MHAGHQCTLSCAYKHARQRHRDLLFMQLQMQPHHSAAVGVGRGLSSRLITSQPTGRMPYTQLPTLQLGSWQRLQSGAQPGAQPTGASPFSQPQTAVTNSYLQSESGGEGEPGSGPGLGLVLGGAFARQSLLPTPSPSPIQVEFGGGGCAQGQGPPEVMLERL